MSPSRKLTFVLAAGLAASSVCGSAYASESPSARRPFALDAPAFRAPEDPPSDPPGEEAGPPEPTGPLSLREAQLLALEWNPELQAFSWETRAMEGRAEQAGQPPNPVLDMRFYRLGIPRQNTPPDEARLRVVLRQDFELGGKGRRRYELARTERDLVEWDYEIRRIEVAAEVTSRFVEVLGAQRRLETWRRTRDYFETMGDRVAVLVERGLVRTLESHELRRQRGLARIEAQRAEGELAAARFALAALWGSRSPGFTDAVGDLEPIAPLPELEAVVELALGGPAVARWDAELDRGEAALALAKAERVPDIEAGAGIRWEEQSNERDYLLDLEVELPFLDRKRGAIREARHEMARARAGRRAAEAAISEEIAALYYRVSEARSRSVTWGDEIVPALRAKFEAYRAGMEASTENLDDLLDARRDLARAEARQIEALVEYHQALASLEALAGESLEGWSGGGARP
jgi:cobalt-zinc-cadmium efflux system outer membrane protein